MTDQKEHLEGGCMCGAVRYRVELPHTYSGVCHCDDCRRATGGAYVPWFGSKPEALTFTKGKPTIYESSPGIQRGFCRDCGASLTFGGEGWDEIGVTIASLDDPNAITPESNVVLKEKLHWVRHNEEMRNYDGLPG